MAEEPKIDIQEVANRYNNLLGEYNKQRKMIDKMAIKIAQHTVEITERDVVIDTLKTMIPTDKLPSAEAAVEAAVSETVLEEE
jgi:CHASE3 domain sensor protein|tara:strand:- start:447 stop:695 length:249 start_codon:yes stop_codon:yes gene_type:complete